MKGLQDNLTLEIPNKTLTQAHHDEPAAGHMGLPLPHGKLAMWLFLVTEILRRGHERSVGGDLELLG